MAFSRGRGEMTATKGRGKATPGGREKESCISHFLLFALKKEVCHVGGEGGSLCNERGVGEMV